MKLKNTLGVVIGSLVAATSLGALAQGQGAVEVEGFAKRYFTDSNRHMDNANLYGASVGYFLTNDVELALSYGEYHDVRTDSSRGNDKVHGNIAALDAIYHFGTPGVGLRPYLSAGLAHQSLGQAQPRSGRNHTTFGNIGAGLKYYFTDNFYARAGLDGMYNIDEDQGEWAAGVGVGLNFGGNAGQRQVAAVEPAPAPAPAPAPEPEPTPEVVRVELDVKFDFDRAQVKSESYADIQNLADFMRQYPQTSTTVEGHTDSIGTEAYNQRLSERRANAVRDVLVNQYGVESNRVSSVGYGESRPVADNSTEQGRAVNRRVEAEVEAQVNQ